LILSHSNKCRLIDAEKNQFCGSALGSCHSSCLRSSPAVVDWINH
jgi:hypothetical protein